MRHPTGRANGIGLFSHARLTQPRLFGALLASVVLHAVLLSQPTHGTRPHTAPEPLPAVLMIHLWRPAPSLEAPPPLVPIAPAERATAETQNARSTARQPQVSVVDSASATATPADIHTPVPVEPPPPSAPSGTHADRPMDLSPQVINQAVRRNSTPAWPKSPVSNWAMKPLLRLPDWGNTWPPGQCQTAFTMHQMARPNPSQ